MHCIPPDVTDLISDILLLAGAKIAKGIPRSAIHSILWKMQAEQRCLSRVRFSITGDVCYSREIDTAINKLLALGALQTTKYGTILLNNLPAGHSSRLGRHDHSQYSERLAASRVFHQRYNELTASASQPQR